MGEVYLAEDTRLSRQVALKVLPAWMEERGLARFEREAKALAALDHPNIVHIYSVEHADGVHFYTMQLVRGTTLQRVLGGGALALNRFYEIAIPLADGIAAAHQAGILHRDLKPGNIMLSDEGRVVVLDFGLAKTIEDGRPALGEERTITATHEGQILGTIAYMSPEQAEGRKLDARSDVFSLGIVLYEMLTGQRPFAADTPAGTLAAIIGTPPAATAALNPAIPRELDRLVSRCLAKPMNRRIQTALDVRNELEYLQSAKTAADLESTQVPTRARRTPWVAAAIGAVILTIAAGALDLSRRSIAPTTSLLQLDNPLQLSTAIGVESWPAWSPDGQRIAFHASSSASVRSSADERDQSDIWVTQAGGGGGLNLTANSQGSNRFPSWSPDGSQIAFLSTRDGGGVFVMPSLGGPARKLFAQPPEVPFAGQIGAAGPPQWSADGTRLAVAFSTLDDQTLILTFSLKTQQTDTHRLPGRCHDLSWSPDGRYFACVEGNATWEVRRIWIIPAETGEHFILRNSEHYNSSPSWSADSRTLYFVSTRGGSGDLWRQPLDATGRAAGSPERVSAGLGAIQATFSPRGDRLAYSRGRSVANVWRVPILDDRPATWADAEQMTAERAETRHIDISPDGSRLVVSTDRSGVWDLWMIPVTGSEWKRLTADASADRGPKFSSDGKQIVFHSFRTGSHDIRVMPAEGGPARDLTDGPATDWFGAWSPDGQHIAFISDRAGSNDIWVVPSSGGTARQLTKDPAKDEWPLWSRDGSQVIFLSSRTTPSRLFQVPAAGGEEQLLSQGAAWTPVWHPNGRVLFFHGSADRATNIWSLSLSDRRERAVTNLAGRAGEIVSSSLATDGRYLYFSWSEDESDIWVIDVKR